MEMRDRNHYARRTYSTNHDERPEDNSLNPSHCFENQTRGTLFSEIRRIPTTHQPLTFQLENMPSPLVNHDGGQSFQTVQNIPKEGLDYHISHRTTNTQP